MGIGIRGGSKGANYSGKEICFLILAKEVEKFCAFLKLFLLAHIPPLLFEVWPTPPFIAGGAGIFEEEGEDGAQGLLE